MTIALATVHVRLHVTAVDSPIIIHVDGLSLLEKGRVVLKMKSATVVVLSLNLQAFRAN